MKLSDYRHHYELQLRWGDADRLGHVNNAKYFTFVEAARTHYVANVVPPDCTDGLWKTQGPVLADIQCTFRRPLFHPGDIIIGTRFELGNRSATVTAGLFEADNLEAPAATSKAIIVWMDYVKEQSKPFPDPVREAIEGFEARDQVLVGR